MSTVSSWTSWPGSNSISKPRRDSYTSPPSPFETISWRSTAGRARAMPVSRRRSGPGGQCFARVTRANLSNASVPSSASDPFRPSIGQGHIRQNGSKLSTCPPQGAQHPHMMVSMPASASVSSLRPESRSMTRDDVQVLSHGRRSSYSAVAGLMEFLQPPPHDDALALLLAFGCAHTRHGDLHPVSSMLCLAQMTA
jgi:hypothetical protein